MLASCSLFREGTLDPGATGDVSATYTTQGPPDGRDMAFTTQTFNYSTTDSVQLDSIELIDPDGLTLIDAFTLSNDNGDNQLPASIWIPPIPDPRSEPEDNVEDAANWELRVPVGESVIGPEGFRQVALQVRPEPDRACVWAKGFRTTYHEYGRKFTVVSNLGIFVFFGDPDADPCQEARDHVDADSLSGG